MPENDMSPCLRLLREPSSLYVDIEAEIKLERNRIRVVSNHRYLDGSTRVFGASWKDPQLTNTEYGIGLSLLHDVKDHYFWGLDISQMAEFQVICQINFGRALISGHPNFRKQAEESIENEVHKELFGPRWPRVYNQNAVGLLVGASAEDTIAGVKAARYFCFEIALPRTEALFVLNSLILDLQRSVRHMPELAAYFLSGLLWSDSTAQLLCLRDNIDFHTIVRAYANRQAAETTLDIYEQWMKILPSLPSPLPWFGYRPLAVSADA